MVFSVKKIFSGIFIIVLSFFSFYVMVEAEDLSQTCKIENLDQKEAQLTRDEWRALLQKCKEYYLEQEKQFQNQVSYFNQQEKTLSNEIAYIDNRIQRLGSQIYQSNLIIKDLNIQLEDTQSSVSSTQDRISGYRQQLGNLLRLSYEKEKHSPWEALFKKQSLFATFHEIAAQESLSNRINESVVGAQDLREYLTKQKDKLAQKKDQLQAEIRLQSIQKNNLDNTQQRKSVLLNQAQQQKSQYKGYLSETQEQIQEIKTRLFKMVDATRNITEYEAIQIAQSVSAETGIDPAFLLAILEQESNIGKNVGTCFLRNPDTGEGIYMDGRHCDQVMKAEPRGWESNANTNDFLAITEQLKMDWQETPVSCPAPFVGSSYGGAMGPAQFIPSTWMKYKYQVENTYAGNIMANPWMPEHAFLAAAMYLKHLGAYGTWRSQFTAAGHYYGCSTCSYRYEVMDRVPRWRDKIHLVQ